MGRDPSGLIRPLRLLAEARIHLPRFAVEDERLCILPRATGEVAATRPEGAQRQLELGQAA